MEFLDYLTVAAFIMSAATWIHKWHENKIDVEIRVLEYIYFPGQKHLFYITIENKSASTVSITNTVLFDRHLDIFIECNPKQKEVYSKHTVKKR